jgi:hypothetical protein
MAPRQKPQWRLAPGSPPSAPGPTDTPHAGGGDDAAMRGPSEPAAAQPAARPRLTWPGAPTSPVDPTADPPTVVDLRPKPPPPLVADRGADAADVWRRPTLPAIDRDTPTSHPAAPRPNGTELRAMPTPGGAPSRSRPRQEDVAPPTGAPVRERSKPSASSPAKPSPPATPAPGRATPPEDPAQADAEPPAGGPLRKRGEPSPATELRSPRTAGAAQIALARSLPRVEPVNEDEAVALAARFAVDYLSFSSGDPRRRAAALRSYLEDPEMGDELGWDGPGQRVELVLPGRREADGMGRVLVEVWVLVDRPDASSSAAPDSPFDCLGQGELASLPGRHWVKLTPTIARAAGGRLFVDLAGPTRAAPPADDEPPF